MVGMTEVNRDEMVENVKDILDHVRDDEIIQIKTFNKMIQLVGTIQNNKRYLVDITDTPYEVGIRFSKSGKYILIDMDYNEILNFRDITNITVMKVKKNLWLTDLDMGQMFLEKISGEM